jgi:hypothetical protein
MLVYSNYGLYSVFLSENAGQNWMKVGGNLEATVNGAGNAPSVRWVSILPFPNGTRKYFCGTSTGLYSADTLLLHATGQPGTQWVLEAPGLIGNSVINQVETRASDGLVVAATHGIGLFSANFQPVSGSHEPAKAPAVRVFPNPVKNTVEFGIAGQFTGNIGVRIFDLKGRLVRTATITAGDTQVEMSGLPAGLYLYDLRGKDWQSSGKVVKE